MVPMPFAMWVGERDGALTVRLAGRLEAPWAAEVHRELLCRFPLALRLDLTGLTVIDGSGVAALAALRHDVVSGGGRAELHGASHSVRATFAAAGLDALVDDEEVLHAAGPSEVGPVTELPLKGGRSARRSPAATPKVA
jgi:anti-anti-sigma factor